ncbi:hypothetical protein M7I_8312 [Glarea lozoyensis 74030]|uniref:NmrA-like domain-containing protein n=1 Tax=Glarea lozoyensis (strain ATCC 74030 / MF5533) TaxID=1104152 RepID=H0EZN6_GLAL7|nr:hypothetical protein M7I_8312 [Glarea lozoyensis 74030]
MNSPDAPVGIIDPYDVGYLAARLLSQDDPSTHNRAKYVLNGPEDITGEGIVELIEGYIGTKVEHVVFKDTSFIEQMAEEATDSKHLILSIKEAPVTAWEGKCTSSTTSKEIFDIAAPKSTPSEVLKMLLAGMDWGKR